MFHRFIRLCSMALVIAMLANMLPAQALGETIRNTTPELSETAATLNTSETTDSQEPEILGEVEKNRTEYTKEYILSNGLNMTTLFPSTGDGSMC